MDDCGITRHLAALGTILMQNVSLLPEVSAV